VKRLQVRALRGVGGLDVLGGSLHADVVTR
jgi:hypothetical protein